MKLIVVMLFSLSLFQCEKRDPSSATLVTKVENGGKGAPPLEMKAWVELPHPGHPLAPPALIKKLKSAVEAKVADKKAFRTKHKKNGLPLFTNRLVLESSPYLQQHAHNPVNWYSWGDEAFDVAALTGRPVFLSIGYSTCHWCHVMEEESFEDLEIAKYLNENYIAIKVDREERPDIDDIYMKAVTIFTGRGGWPMSVWLTEDRTPYDGGTYFPARTGDRGSRIGYLELLKKNKAAYSDPETLIKAQNMTAKMSKGANLGAKNSKLLKKPKAALRSAMRYFERSFDAVNGGWGRTKFPMPSRLRFLMRYYRRTGEKPDMLIQTLDAMADGGINDQIGGGFHRYTVEATWTVPHFEKMLYDNAQLALLYTEAYQFLGDEKYKRVAIETLGYLEKEMLDGTGAFYAATDADSGGEEGSFFIWSYEAVKSLFEDDLVLTYFGVSKRGNFEGKNILTRRRKDSQIREKYGLSEAQLKSSIENIRQVLYEKRKSKTPPDRDEKIVCAWNALAAEAFASAGFVFSEPKFTKRAGEILDAIHTNLSEEGVLYRSGISQKAGFKKGPIALAEDYAFTIHAALKLFQVSSDTKWYHFAKRLQKDFDENFLEKGVYNRRSKRAPAVLIKEQAWKDGAVPSANAYAAMNAMIWKRITNEEKWNKRMDAIFSAYSPRLRRSPIASPTMLVALDGYTDMSKEVFIVGEKNEELLKKMRLFNPNATFFVASGEDKSLVEAVPWLSQKVPKGGKATAYVCHDFICKLPTNSAAVFEEQLRDLEKL